MNQLEDMRVFVSVAERSSFTQAALNLSLPRASISTAVQRLENLLGVRLLHRTTRQVSLTLDGVAYYERCREVLAELDEMQSMFQPAQTTLRGRLRADMPLGLAHSIVVPRLPEFMAQHPEIEIELSSTDRRVDLAAEGFDCVVRVGTMADSSLIARTLGHYRQINCASPAYLAQHGMPQCLADLAQHRLIHYVSTLGAKPLGFEYVDAAQPDVPQYLAMAGALTVNNSAAYQAACLAGLGIIQAPDVGLASLIDRGQLVEVLPQFRAPSMPVSLLYGNRRNVSKRVQAFMNWLAGVITPRLTEGGEHQAGQG